MSGADTNTSGASGNGANPTRCKFCNTVQPPKPKPTTSATSAPTEAAPRNVALKSKRAARALAGANRLLMTRSSTLRPGLTGLAVPGQRLLALRHMNSCRTRIAWLPLQPSSEIQIQLAFLQRSNLYLRCHELAESISLRTRSFLRET